MSQKTQLQTLDGKLIEICDGCDKLAIDYALQVGEISDYYAHKIVELHPCQCSKKYCYQCLGIKSGEGIELPYGDLLSCTKCNLMKCTICDNACYYFKDIRLSDRYCYRIKPDIWTENDLDVTILFKDINKSNICSVCYIKAEVASNRMEKNAEISRENTIKLTDERKDILKTIDELKHRLQEL